MYEDIAILAGIVCLYAIVAGPAERSPIGGAVAHLAVGFAAGTTVLGLLDLELDSELLRLLAEMALALVLFGDASKADFRVLAKAYRIPERLILASLPLVILAGFGAAALLLGGLSWMECAILGALVAPTDAALGKPVETSASVPDRIRESLNFESGLNDGLCVPFFLTFLAVALGDSEAAPLGGYAIGLIVSEVGVGALVGYALATLAAGLLRISETRGWLKAEWMQVPVVALAVATFAAAQGLGGSGFIACFTGGLVFGALMQRRKNDLTQGAETAGDVLSAVIWVSFGAVVLPSVVPAITWQMVAFAVLALTILRMGPVWLVLWGLDLRAPEKLFIGWFGPRGLATIVFAVMVADSGLPGADTVVATAFVTVLLSVLAHGISANPLIRRLARTESAGQ